MLNKYEVSNSQTIVVDVKEDSKYQIHVQPHTQGSLILEVRGQGELDLEVIFGDNSTWSYLYINKSDDTTIVTETIQMDSHSEVHLNYAELSYGHHTKDTNINLRGEHASAHTKGAILCYDHIKWSIRANHLAKHTYALLKTSAILYKKAHLNIEVIGYIEKGKSKSETHQFTKILNLGTQVEGIVYPKLLIDENDVAASHAASVGQPNPEELYYLQSRGLTKQEALQLIALGYLMPIVDDIDNESIKKNIKEEIEKKVHIS